MTPHNPMYGRIICDECEHPVEYAFNGPQTLGKVEFFADLAGWSPVNEECTLVMLDEQRKVRVRFTKRLGKTSAFDPSPEYEFMRLGAFESLA